MTNDNEHELIEAFLTASSTAEVDPSEELLRSLQQISAVLAKSPGNAWGSGREDTVPTGSGFHSDPLADSSGSGLDENTGVAEEDLPATTNRVRNLVKEARVYIQLSLFDLAEGAISRALHVFERYRNEDSFDEEAGRDAITGVFRVDDLRDHAVDKLLAEARRGSGARRISVMNKGEEGVQFLAVDGEICFGARVDGKLFLDDAFRTAWAAEFDGAQPDAPGPIPERVPESLIGHGLRVTARAALLAAESMLEPGFVLQSEPAAADQCANLRFAPLAVRAHSRSLANEVVDPVADAFFEYLVADSVCSLVVRHVGGKGRVVAVRPTRGWEDGVADMVERAADSLRAAVARLSDEWQVLWLSAADGAWAVGIGPKSVVMHHCSEASTRRAMSRIASFEFEPF